MYTTTIAKRVSRDISCVETVYVSTMINVTPRNITEKTCWTNDFPPPVCWMYSSDNEHTDDLANRIKDNLCNTAS